MQRRQRRQRERQKSNRFRLAKQQLCTCITHFCIFRSRHRTTTTWKCLFYVLPRTQDDDFLFLFLNFDTVFYNSTPEKDSCQHSTNWTKGNKRDKVWRSATSLFVSSAKHRHYEKTLKSSGKCFIYGKLLRHTNEVSLRFLLRDTLHEAFFTGYQEGNIIDNHS